MSLFKTSETKWSYGPEPTRTEEIALKVTLDKAGADRHAGRFAGTGFEDALVRQGEGDTLNLAYSFSCLYFGRVEAYLALFEALIADPDVVVDASINELNHGRSVLVDLVAQLTRVRDALAGPPEPEPELDLGQTLRALASVHDDTERLFLEWCADRVEHGLVVHPEPGPKPEPPPAFDWDRFLATPAPEPRPTTWSRVRAWLSFSS